MAIFSEAAVIIQLMEFSYSNNPLLHQFPVIYLANDK